MKLSTMPVALVAAAATLTVAAPPMPSSQTLKRDEAPWGQARKSCQAWQITENRYLYASCKNESGGTTTSWIDIDWCFTYRFEEGETKYDKWKAHWDYTSDYVEGSFSDICDDCSTIVDEVRCWCNNPDERVLLGVVVGERLDNHNGVLGCHGWSGTVV